MNNEDLILNLIISLIITVVAYCTVPIILRLKNGKYEYEKGQKIVITNCIIVCIFFVCMRLSQGAEKIVSPAVFLYYYINKAILLKPKEESEEDIKEESIETVKKDEMDEDLYQMAKKDYKEMPKEMEEKPQPQKKGNNKTLLYIVISILVFTVVGISIFSICLYNENKDLKTKKPQTATTTSTTDNKSYDNYVTKENFKEKMVEYESIATEIWVSGDETDTLFDELIIIGDVGYRFMKLGVNSPIYTFYKINFIKSGSMVEVYYDDVLITGEIKSNRLELYMEDGFTIYANYIKK